jgi:ribosomal RNA-processing protein 36
MWWIYWLLLLANSSTAEQKKLALIDRFQNMKSKQRDHVIERRRKKVTAKERRNMPERRGA